MHEITINMRSGKMSVEFRKLRINHLLMLIVWIHVHMYNICSNYMCNTAKTPHMYYMCNTHVTHFLVI